MTEFWETTFGKVQLAWGPESTAFAALAGDYFSRANVETVLIPGIGYGRNAKPFLARGDGGDGGSRSRKSRSRSLAARPSSPHPSRLSHG